MTFLASLATTAGGDAERRELPVLPRGIRKVVGRTLFADAGEDSLDLIDPGERGARQHHVPRLAWSRATRRP